MPVLFSNSNTVQIGDFGGYGSRASAEFFGGGQSSNGGFGSGVSGGGHPFNHYQV